MDLKRATRDRVVAEIARKQHGVVSISQLKIAGVSETAVRRRVEAGRLHRLYRGVYAVGHAGISREAGWMAAVLASGEGAVLSHGSAAAHWGLLRPLAGPVDVSITSDAGRRRRAGIRLHRRAGLAPAAVTRHRGIPLTTPGRTVADLPGAVTPRLARRALRQAEMLGLPLGDTAGDGTRSDLEREFLRLCRRNAVPVPEVNVRIERWTVDFLWRARRLVVETDGYAYHRGKVAFEDDRDRDLGLRELGYDVVRISEKQLTDDKERIAASLLDALGRDAGR